MGQGDFGYRQISEEKDELDFKNLLSCPHCKKPIPADATMCLYCGEGVDFSSNRLQSWVIWVAAILIVIFMFFVINAIH